MRGESRRPRRVVSLWTRGLIRRRAGRIIALASAIALTVALIGCLGAFVTFARLDVGRRAVAAPIVDWQIKLAAGTTPPDAVAAVPAQMRPSRWEAVGYGDAGHFEAITEGTVQTTGAGKLVGLPPSYTRSFPGEIRGLVGRADGVLLAQQTAANLHARPGDGVDVVLAGGRRVRVTVDGVVDLPEADSFFQAVGAAAGAGPSAPPDNVMLLPIDRWRQLFDPAKGDGTIEVHARLPRNLPSDPSAAFAKLHAIRRNYEAGEAGAVAVGDNLAARLDGARSEATYGQLLFLFLGFPGVVIGIALAAIAASAGRERRRAEHALLRARGASPSLLVRLALAEAGSIGAAGAIAGAIAATAAARASWRLPPHAIWGWIAVAAATGVVSSLVAVALPAARDARATTVASARRPRRPHRRRLWLTLAGWTSAALAAAAVWSTTRAGYQVVVAPEGVPTVSVDYASLLGPLLVWIAGATFLAGAAGVVLARGRFAVAGALRAVAGTLGTVVAAWLVRLRPVVVRSSLLLGLAVAFAVSTAVFDRTFAAQSVVDADLTNGADVSASAPPGIDLGATTGRIARLPKVRAVEPMQHRFTYVGNDLQDLFGIRPLTLGRATQVSDAYFAGGHARDRLRRLAATPDGVFVSDETVLDFQLRTGDTIKLRLLDARSHSYTPIVFRLLGVVREFPTAPTDSFVVANADYVAAQTHTRSFETVLVRTPAPVAVAREMRTIVPPTTGARIADIVGRRRATASGLVALDLGGLTSIELSFGFLVTAGAVALLLAVGFTERRRNFVLLKAIGARRSQIASFLVGETTMVTLLGLLGGAILGATLAWVLVGVLKGVFDPPPQHPLVPWAYIGALAGSLVAGVTGAVLFMVGSAERASSSDLRDALI